MRNESTGKVKIELRELALMFARRLPEMDNTDLTGTVNAYLEELRKLPTESKIALKCAYVWASRAPREVREDMYQDLLLALLQQQTKDEKLAYSIARCDWQNWWAKYYRRAERDGGTIDAEVSADNEANGITLSELLVGEIEFEAKMCARLDARNLLATLPAQILSIGKKRLLGNALNAAERQQLCRFVKNNPLVYLTAQSC